MANTNCELEANRAYAEIEHQENMQAVLDERQRQVDQEQRQLNEEKLRKEREAAQAREARLADIRRAPSSPEIGSTSVECRDICVAEEGEPRVTRGDRVLFSCLVGGEPIWVAEVRQGQGAFVVSGIKTLYENADVLKLRADVEARLGPADAVEVVKDHRVWTWTREDLTVTVGSYPEGAFLSSTTPAPEIKAVLQREWPEN